MDEEKTMSKESISAPLQDKKIIKSPKRTGKTETLSCSSKEEEEEEEEGTAKLKKISDVMAAADSLQQQSSHGGGFSNSQRHSKKQTTTISAMSRDPSPPPTASFKIPSSRETLLARVQRSGGSTKSRADFLAAGSSNSGTEGKEWGENSISEHGKPTKESSLRAPEEFDNNAVESEKTARSKNVTMKLTNSSHENEGGSEKRKIQATTESEIGGIGEPGSKVEFASREEPVANPKPLVEEERVMAAVEIGHTGGGTEQGRNYVERAKQDKEEGSANLAEVAAENMKSEKRAAAADVVEKEDILMEGEVKQTVIPISTVQSEETPLVMNKRTSPNPTPEGEAEKKEVVEECNKEIECEAEAMRINKDFADNEDDGGKENLDGLKVEGKQEEEAEVRKEESMQVTEKVGENTKKPVEGGNGEDYETAEGCILAQDEDREEVDHEVHKGIMDELKVEVKVEVNELTEDGKGEEHMSKDESREETMEEPKEVSQEVPKKNEQDIAREIAKNEDVIEEAKDENKDCVVMEVATEELASKEVKEEPEKRAEPADSVQAVVEEQAEEAAEDLSAVSSSIERSTVEIDLNFTDEQALEDAGMLCRSPKRRRVDLDLNEAEGEVVRGGGDFQSQEGGERGGQGSGVRVGRGVLDFDLNEGPEASSAFGGDSVGAFDQWGSRSSKGVQNLNSPPGFPFSLESGGKNILANPANSLQNFMGVPFSRPQTSSTSPAFQPSPFPNLTLSKEGFAARLDLNSVPDLNRQEGNHGAQLKQQGELMFQGNQGFSLGVGHIYEDLRVSTQSKSLQQKSETAKGDTGEGHDFLGLAEHSKKAFKKA